MRDTLTIAEIKSMLAARMPQLASELAPVGKKQGYYWMAANPSRSDRKPGSFVIWIAGKAAGAWIDYATGDKGDAIDLVAYLACGARPPFSREDRVAAIRWAKGWLGLATATPALVAQKKHEATAAQAARDAGEAEARARKLAWAQSLWADSADIAGTLAEIYLREARQIDLEAIPTFTGHLRFLARVRHPHEEFYAPAMIARMTRPDGGFAGVHLTYLRDDGYDKAPVGQAKIVIGAKRGAVIWISNGAGDLPPQQASARRIAGLCFAGEGIEDTCSAAMARPDARCAAAIDLGNIGFMPGLPCVAGWIVCADNDEGKPQAQAAFETALARLRLCGKPVSVARSPAGKDMNDLLRSRMV